MSIIEMKVPTIGESVTEVTLSEWLKKDGEFVNIDEPICEFESDKATLEFPAEVSGKLIHVAKEGDDLEIGGLVARIDTSAVQPDALKEEESPKQEQTAKNQPETTQSEPTKTSYATGHPSPAAAKILTEKNIATSSVSGTGKDGRITKEDAQNAQPTSIKLPEPESTPKVFQSFSRNIRMEKMSRMRRTIASRLVSAKNNTAMLTTLMKWI